MRSTMAVTSIITTTGSMTVEADTPEAAQEQVEAALKHAWRHAPSAWQAGIDLLNDGCVRRYRSSRYADVHKSASITASATFGHSA